nr:metalloregulator ArsR/SmtB family transcription factor [Sporosalibacterium faouarense]
MFKALADETRLKILIILSRRRICAKGIANYLSISEAAVSQHIKVLREAGIIIGRKVGYYVHYDLQKKLLLDIEEFIGQLNNDEAINAYKLDINIPDRCKASCKSNKNKCCQRDNN